MAVHAVEICMCIEIALAGITLELFGDDEQIKAGRKQGGQQEKKSNDKEIREEVFYFLLLQETEEAEQVEGPGDAARRELGLEKIYSTGL